MQEKTNTKMIWAAIVLILSLALLLFIWKYYEVQLKKIDGKLEHKKVTVQTINIHNL